MEQPYPTVIHKIFLFLSTVLLSCCLVGCSATDGSKTSSVLESPHMVSTNSVSVSLGEAQKQEIGLKIAEVRTGLIYKTVEAPGRVGPDAELLTLVSTPSAGRAIEVNTRLGDVVTPGQVMAIIKSDPIGQVQSDLLLNALQAKADIKQQQVQLKLSRITFERESKLFSEQVSAKADLQAAENQLEKDMANLTALQAKLDAIITTAQERLTLLGAPPNSARKVVAQKKIDPMVVIRAPRRGLVIDRAINPGELNDGTKPLFTLADLSEVWLFADIFEKDIEEVKKRQEAIVSVDSLPGHTFPAEIIWVGDSLNPTSRTLPARANVPNPDLILKPGMFARLKINVGHVPVLLVPHSAVIQQGDKVLVFVEVRNRTYQAREVTTGVEDANNIQICSGLKPGERVVVNGSTALLGTVMKTAEGNGD